MSDERLGTLEFMHWCEVQPDALALTHRGMGMSYHALGQRVFGEMERLAKSGFGPDQRLAVVPGVTFDHAARLLAAIELRVPLVLIHPALPSADQRARAKSANARFFDEGAASSRAHPENENDDTFAVLFTSGTSGEAKKVRLARAAVAAALDGSAARLGWNEEDRWGLFLPPAHIGGLSVLLRCLRAGKTVVLSGESAALPTVCAMERVTMLSLVPTQLHRLLEAGVRLPSAVRVILVGGAPLSSALRQRAEESGYPIFPTYGMTETCAQAATALLDEPGCGQLLGGLEGEIRDGLLWLRGPSLFDGYERRGTLDRSAFDPDGFFCTGDQASFDVDGNLHVLGRLSEMIITGGENVDPAEVEDALLASEAFEAVCVVGVPSEEWGQTVGLVAVLKQGIAPETTSALCCAAALPGYARPKLFRVVEALPRTPLGKVKRDACCRLLLTQPTPI